MPIKTLKQCDHCAAESFDETFELYEVSVQVRKIAPTLQPMVKAFPHQHWCRECVSQTALLGISEKEMEARRQASLAPVIPATFEGMIREIASEVASEIAEDAVSEGLRNR